MEHLLEKIEATASFIKKRINKDYRFGIILGSGLSNLSKAINIHIQLPYSDIPNFPISTVIGHTGTLIFGELGGVNIIAMSGRLHYYEGYTMQEVVFPVRVMKYLGVTHLFISNAAGGLNPDFELGDLMIIRDHIYMHPENPLRGKNEIVLGPRFPNMNNAYNKDLINRALEIALENNIRCHTGVYVGVQGPSFETPAEYRMFHMWGADAVGMSTTPEVVTARHMNMEVFAISVISDIGYPPEKADHVTHEMVLNTAKEAEPKLRTIVEGLLKSLQ
ncbi:MAG: purine-nucleoside phosphorylase [Chitinophagales bacterium]|nr:purine-nucleoside phosphorylase [Chitinophagales bacterium]MDW8274248.1 purine-nucleoside phosphorylase [Chitinophagales bacterium]